MTLVKDADFVQRRATDSQVLTVRFDNEGQAPMPRHELADAAHLVQLAARFDSVCRQLNEPQFIGWHHRPLLFWTLRDDRRLPRTFLSEPVGTLIGRNYTDLIRTRGVGHKKMTALVELLERAVQTQALGVPPSTTVPAESDGLWSGVPAGVALHKPVGLHDPERVSDAMWEEWRDLIVSHGVHRETIGRLAPTLQMVPTTMWTTPLIEYLSLSLSQIRKMKAFGDKRVAALVATVQAAYHVLAASCHAPHLSVSLAPRYVGMVESWLDSPLMRSNLPTRDELLNQLAFPLAEQIRCDLGDTICDVVSRRLGIGRTVSPIREQAEVLGLTKARLYQFFEECQSAMQVRWPSGPTRLEWMVHRYRTQGSEANASALRLCEEIRTVLIA